MTGFGLAEAENERLKVRCEVRCLNGKFLELSLKTPRILNAIENKLKRAISSRVERGTLSVAITLEYKDIKSVHLNINRPLAMYYYRQLSELADEMGCGRDDIFKSIITLPDVLAPATDDGLSEDDLNTILSCIYKSLDELDKYRLTEGEEIAREMTRFVQNIESELSGIASQESGRVPRIRERIIAHLESLKLATDINKDRLEQEMIYYLEKLDIGEEKSRLGQHCHYFLQTLHADSGGKKLGFIAQEMGREINTLGAKANDFKIQQSVVRMKDDLEKIKEQVNNIL